MTTMSKDNEMTEQDQPQPAQITDQGAFLRQLGVDPSQVVPNTVAVEFNHEGIAVVSWRVAVGITPQALGLAFLAGGGGLGGGADAESQPIDGNVTPLTKPGRRAAAKKTTAKKAVAKKTTPKKQT